MSWGFTFAAKSKSAAKAEIDRIAAQPHSLPMTVAEIMKGQIEMLPEPAEDRVILVESNGHIDHSPGSWAQNGNAKFMVTLLGIVSALLLALFAAPTFAQESPPEPKGPLAFALGTSWGLELHLNVSVVAGTYDLTHKAWIGQMPITGLYALTSTKLHNAGIAAGGSLTFDSESRPTGEGNVGLISPAITLSPNVKLHGALLYGRRFGFDAASLIRFAPTLSF